MREPQRSPAAHRRPAMEWAAWIAALACVSALLAAVGFESLDPDSALHASIVGQSFERPVAEWIAPSWGGNWTRTDLYREHPAGIFLLPSALARMGYPALQSAYLMNAVFQILTVLALTSFCRLVLPRRRRADSRLAPFAPPDCVHLPSEGESRAGSSAVDDCRAVHRGASSNDSRVGTAAGVSGGADFSDQGRVRRPRACGLRDLVRVASAAAGPRRSGVDGPGAGSASLPSSPLRRTSGHIAA